MISNLLNANWYQFAINDSKSNRVGSALVVYKS